MANEFTMSGLLKINKGDLSLTRNVSNYQADQTGDGFVYQKVSVGTTPVALDMGGVTTAGYYWMRNCDNTNYITIGQTSGSYVHQDRLDPSDFTEGKLSHSAPWAQADTAPVELEYWINEK